MAIAVKMLPLNGTLRLCKKLPKTISEAAQIVPRIEALIHFSLISYLWFIRAAWRDRIRTQFKNHFQDKNLWLQNISKL